MTRAAGTSGSADTGIDQATPARNGYGPSHQASGALAAASSTAVTPASLSVSQMACESSGIQLHGIKTDLRKQACTTDISIGKAPCPSPEFAQVGKKDPGAPSC